MPQQIANPQRAVLSHVPLIFPDNLHLFQSILPHLLPHPTTTIIHPPPRSYLGSTTSTDLTSPVGWVASVLISKTHLSSLHQRQYTYTSHLHPRSPVRSVQCRSIPSTTTRVYTQAARYPLLLQYTYSLSTTPTLTSAPTHLHQLTHNTSSLPTLTSVRVKTISYTVSF